MNQLRPTHRRAIGLLLAAAALPATPAFGQDTTVQSPPATTPTPVPTATVPPPVTATPPLILPTPTPSPTSSPAISTIPPIVTPTPRVVPPPVVSTSPPADPPAAEPAETAEDPPAARTTRRVETVAPEPAEPPPAAEGVAPVAGPVLPQPIVPVPAPEVAAAPAPATEQPAGAPVWPLLLGVAALIVAIGVWLVSRRRSAEVDDYDEPVEEPALATAAADPAPAPIEPARPAPAAAAPEPEPSIEALAVTEPDSADVEALAAASAPVGDRPWLELMMRPVRAGTNEQDAVVEFELTVGNTGSVPAEDVRITTWMFAAGSPQDSEMERLLIDPPADARVSETTIAPGDGTRVDASIALPRSGLRGTVLPVIVADARYRLPGGGEGRTSASFEVGIAVGDGIEPFPIDGDSQLREDIDSRLHGELHRA